jgi:hypothetical protein
MATERPAKVKGARATESATPKPPINAAPPVAQTASATVTPQPFTPQTVTAPVRIEQPLTGAAAPVTPAVAPSDEERIRAMLGTYQAAYEQLDPHAVQAVWPSVDTRALTRAFNALSSQSIVFDRCDVTVAAATATADCNGFMEYVTRVGGGTQSAWRQWVFDLQKPANGGWQIKSVTSH